MTSMELLEETRRLYPDLFRVLDTALAKLTLEENVRLLASITTAFTLVTTVDENTYIQAAVALNASLDWTQGDPEKHALHQETLATMKSYGDKMADLNMKKLTQDKGDHS